MLDCVTQNTAVCRLPMQTLLKCEQVLEKLDFSNKQANVLRQNIFTVNPVKNNSDC